jgi:hypothetical protein
MAAGLFLLAVLIAKSFPATPTGRWLHLYLVEVPLQSASRLETKHLVFVLIGLFAWQAFALAVPIDLALVAAWDLAIYVDAVACVSTVALITRGKAALSVLKAKIARISNSLRPPRPAGKRQRRAKSVKPSPASNDDDEAASLRKAA